MRICVINTHTNNFGDDAASVALAEQIRESFPDAYIDFLYNVYKVSGAIPFFDDRVRHFPEIVITKRHFPSVLLYLLSKIFPFIPLRPNEISKTKEIIAQADYVISGPCGANIGIYKDWMHLLRLMIAVLEGYCPIIYLNTIGRSGSLLFDFIAKYILKRCKIYVRESKSKEELFRWHINAEQGVDTVFSLKAENLEFETRFLPYIAIVPSQIENWHVSFRNKEVDQAAQAKYSEVVEFALSHRYAIKIIPHLTGAYNEYKYLEKFRKKLIDYGISENEISIQYDVDTFRKYEKYIANARLVISMRYHGVIFSIKNAVPFISISYESKMYEACKYSDMRKFNIPLNSIKEYNLLNILIELDENRKNISSALKGLRGQLSYYSRLPIEGLKLAIKTL